MNTEKVSSLLDSWIDEDSALKDVTTQLIDSKKNAEFIVTGGPGVLSGSIITTHLMSKVGLICKFLKSDGDSISNNETIALISGEFNLILSRERLFLNLLSHLSGISTLTKEIVDIVNSTNSNTTVLATRKTTPGLRFLEKEAVIHGGGAPHRFDLNEAILVKDNHLNFIDNLETYVKNAKNKYPDKKIEVEADTINQALTFVHLPIDRLMLDNFTPKEAKKAYSKIKEINPSLEIEISGGLNKKNILDYVNCADFLSLSCLTMNAPPIDFSIHVNKN
ncbi:MAG: nicotinate-nucleotide diphosphorylase (carboxylating) [Marine Group III euryarchaeote CG-Bathy1]|uniref:Nicotinate-nucleotide pyrophosphorylase [carboxylating] n=1 Tax=Marine Group III euryarchaeote CG-Bathy1 TaxID=1889001 RepID=A0A1J5U2I5_9ARCH|nr:MAG: nicotinate-nucleotide diphosphorylase (carboxylating) [Marine Group III euryarchaeote CG-Bathy1]